MTNDLSMEAPMDIATPARPSGEPLPEPCHGATCTADSLVHWQRRLTPAEVDVEHAREQAKRAGWLELRDIAQPAPDYGPLPDASTYSYLVHACGDHAIGMDAAALVHQADCPGPDSERLPECGCDPEPLPTLSATPEQQLPAHWAAAMAGGD